MIIELIPIKRASNLSHITSILSFQRKYPVCIAWRKPLAWAHDLIDSLEDVDLYIEIDPSSEDCKEYMDKHKKRCAKWINKNTYVYVYPSERNSKENIYMILFVLLFYYGCGITFDVISRTYNDYKVIKYYTSK